MVASDALLDIMAYHEIATLSEPTQSI